MPSRPMSGEAAIDSIGPTDAKVTPIITGRRMPTPGKPRHCTSVASPQANRSALIRKATSSGGNLSARPMISGTATAPAYITSTCWSPSASRRGTGKTSSTGCTSLLMDQSPEICLPKLIVQRRKQPVRLEGRRREADAGGIGNRVAEGGGDRIVRTLAHRFRAQRADRVGGLGEEDFGAGHIREGGKMVVVSSRVDDAALRIDHHLLVERGTECLLADAIDLTAALHGIRDLAGVRRMHAPEKPGLAGAPSPCD